MKRKVYSLLVAICIFSTTMGVSAFASEQKESAYPIYFNGAGDMPLPSAQEQLRALENSRMSEEEKAEIRRKLTLGLNDDLPRSIRAGWTRFSGFKVMPQETKWYCGPATVQSAIQFIKGSAEKQSTIATALGTTEEDGTYMLPILEYMNKKQKRNQYVSQNPSTTLKTMKYAFNDSLIDFDTPPIVSVKVNKADQDVWGFSSSGHYILITGSYNGAEKVEISDVNAKNLGNEDKRDLDVELVYKAMQLKGVGFIY